MNDSNFFYTGKIPFKIAAFAAGPWFGVMVLVLSLRFSVLASLRL
jgi:hypothetical protein